MPLTLEEQEIIVTWTRTDEYANFYTSDPVMIRRMKKLMAQSNGEIKAVREDEDSLDLLIPKDCIKITPPKKKRQLSDEERQRRSERMKQARAKKGQTAK